MKLKLEPVLIYAFDPVTKKCSCKTPDCTSPGKHPVGGGKVVTDKQKLKDWHGGIGTRVGNFLVVDIDPKNGGAETFKKLTKVLGPLPQDTPRVRTGSGGYHYYLQRPPEVATTMVDWAKGIDIKVSGILVTPPSPHVSGNKYEWEVQPGEMAELPEPWLKAIVSQVGDSHDGDDLPDLHERVAAAKEKVRTLPASVSGHGGHNKAMSAAVWICRGFAIEDEDAAVEVFKTTFNGRCVDSAGNPEPWSDKDIRHKIADAIKTSSIPRGFGLAPLMAKDLGLRKGPKGGYSTDVENLRLLFKNHKDLQDVRYNERADLVYCRWPWRKETTLRPMHDSDIFEVQAWILRKFKLGFGREDVAHAIEHVARERTYDPLRETLEAMHWDGKPRLGSWLIDYLGAEDTPYTRAAGEIWLRGAVARVMNPGVKFDLSLILEGDQGIGKTQTFEILSIGHHLETSLELDRRGEDEMCRRLHGSESWMIELSELVAFRKSTTEAIKSFLTRTQDKFRKPYARVVTIRPRSFVFCGSTNDSEYLQDEGGNRRFLPVHVTHLQREELLADREMLLAEAVQTLKTNSSLVLPSTVWAAAKEQQESRRLQTPTEVAISDILQHRTVVSTADLAQSIYGERALSQARSAFTRQAVGILRNEGFAQRRVRMGGRNLRLYVRESTQLAGQDILTQWQKERASDLPAQVSEKNPVQI